MNRSFFAGVVVAAGFALCGITWVALPWIQDREQAVSAEVSTQLERARRLLYKHDFGLDRKSLLLDEFQEAGAHVEDVDAVELADSAADDYQAIHERLWNSFRPVEFVRGEVRQAKASYGNLERQIQDGIAARKSLVVNNDQWLNQALDAVEEALSSIDRDVPAAVYAEAYRLKGVILYQMGVNEWLKVQAKWRQAEPFRQQLASDAGRISSLKSASSTVADSKVNECIAELKARETQLEETLRKDQDELGEINGTVAGLKKQLADAESRRNVARSALDARLEKGIELTDPHGADSFRAKVQEESREFRDAEREISVLTYGDYESARLTRPGDFLGSTYVQTDSSAPPTVRPGLRHYEDRSAALTARLQIQTAALETLRSDDFGRLHNIKKSCQDEEDKAARMVADALSNARDEYDELNRIESEAYVLEDGAIRYFEDSAAACDRAAASERDWTQNARNRMAGVALSAQDRSAFAARSDDEWMSGFILAQKADAQMALAWIHYGRYEHYQDSLKAIESIAPVGDLAEADPDDVRQKINMAREAGVDSVSNALTTLEKAHRAAEQHWTITAQAAGAQYMRVLFGFPAALKDAVAAYQSALKGREDAGFAAVLVKRLKSLEGR